ncbi:hypothetical protein RND81_14G054800 [Saponaria officinalis]|uniref:GAG-pre-integrase domain-containing protein n=1 Tax=Saponaria officinalis TaxID=3572 RepID=A0AAW1GUL1_SAPOF
MTSRIHILHNIQSLSKLVMVGLPDVSVKLVTQIGELHLTPRVTFHKVLVVPDFSQNLLSVGRLADHNNIQAIFNSTDCIFQDRSNKAVIGTAHRHGSLYWFTHCKHSTSISHSCLTSNALVDSHIHSVHNKDVSLALLHARMGHSSIEKMKHVIQDAQVEMKNFFFL